MQQKIGPIRPLERQPVGKIEANPAWGEDFAAGARKLFPLLNELA
ncbi:MAG: hypothetical protein WAO02_13335 [Verrucomicrobiia bacterium]